MKKVTLEPEEYLIGGIDPYDFTVEQIGNSKLYLKQVPWSTCVYVRLVFNVGAIHDPVGKEGLAHFLEHMMFSGTPTYSDKFQITQFSKKYTLDSLNAFTTYANTVVMFRCLPENLEHALSGVYEMVTSPLCKEADVTAEKEIITQEAWGKYKNETLISYRKKSLKNIFSDFPDRLRILSAVGMPETIATITKKDLESMLKEYYIQENMSVVFAGNFSQREKMLVSDFIKKIPNGIPSREVFVPEKVNPPIDRVQIHTYGEIGITPSKQTYVDISSGRELSYSHGRTGVFTLAKLVLKEVLTNELRHKKSWCYSVGVKYSYSEDFVYAGIDARVDLEYAEEALSIIRNVIKDICGGSYVDVFEQEKDLIIQRKKAVEIVTSDILEWATDSLINREKIEKRKDFLESIYSVEFEDVQQAIRDMFINSNLWMYEVHLPDDVDLDRRKSLSENLRVRISE